MHLLAYLDPGSASALLAAVLAGVAGIGAAMRSFGNSFKNIFFFWKKDEPEPAEPAEPTVTEPSEDEAVKQS